MADIFNLFIKSETGKTRVVKGHKDQHGLWVDLEGTRYYFSPDTPGRGEKLGKDGLPEKWTILDTVRTEEKRGK